MQFVSNNSSVIYQPKPFPAAFPASCTSWIQNNLSEPLFHYHDCLELGLCVHGNGVEMINYRPFTFSDNTLSIIHKNCLHDSQILLANDYEKRSEWRYIFVDLEKLGLPEDNYGYISKDPLLVSLFQIMYNELVKEDDNYQEVFKGLLQSLLVIASRSARFNGTYEIPESSSEIIESINYISRFYREDISVEFLAQRNNMSKSTFHREFMKCTGATPLAFLNRTRLSVAESLLKSTKMSILEISENVGYNSLSSFNRLFKKEYGCAPSTLRKKK